MTQYVPIRDHSHPGLQIEIVIMLQAVEMNYLFQLFWHQSQRCFFSALGLKQGAWLGFIHSIPSFTKFPSVPRRVRVSWWGAGVDSGGKTQTILCRILQNLTLYVTTSL